MPEDNAAPTAAAPDSACAHRRDAADLAAALHNLLGCPHCAAGSAGCGYWRDAEAALARHEEPNR